MAQAQIVVLVNRAPVLVGAASTATPIAVAPPGGGTALETEFALETDKAAWDDDDRPLSFKWSYTVPGGEGGEEEVPLNDYQVCLYTFLPKFPL